MNSEWMSCLRLLADKNSSTKRKEAAKQAATLLDADKVAALDNGCRRIDAGDAEGGSVATWGLLLKQIMVFVVLELEAAVGKKTALAANVSSLFRKCVRKAEEPHRVAALGHVLLKSIDKIFSHVLLALGARTATPQLLVDYTTALRESLLPVPAFCHKVTPDTYAQLVEFFIHRCDAHEALGPDDAHRSSAVLAELLRRCAHDLDVDCWHNCLEFFRDAFRDDGVCGMSATGAPDIRLKNHVMSAMNTFLLRWGADVAHDSQQVAAAVAPYLKRVWAASHTTRKVKDECFVAAHILLRLEVLPAVPGLLQCTLDAAVAEVERRTADAMRAQSENRAIRAPLLSDAHEARLLQLVADLWAHHASGGPGWTTAAGGDDDDDEDDALPRKRARTLDPWASLVEAACAGGRALLPALAWALRRHGSQLPQRSLVAAVQPVWRCVLSTLGADRPSADAASAVWALRCLRELAKLAARGDTSLGASAAAPDESPAGGAQSSEGDVAAASSAAVLPCWAEFGDHLLRWICNQSDNGALSSEALQTAAALVARGLAPPLRAPEMLWAVPLFSSPSRVALASAAALFARPAGSSAATLCAAEGTGRQEGVIWALGALAPLPLEQIAMSGPRRKEEPPDVRGVADALRALCMGLPPPAHAADAAAPWGEEDAFDEALLLLRRGVDPSERAAQLAAAAPYATPPQQPHLSAPVAKALLTTAGRALAGALDAARDVAHIFALQAVVAELGLASAVLQDAPDGWGSPGAVSAASARAMERAQGVLVDNSPPARLFTPRLLVAAQALGAAAALEPAPPADATDTLAQTALRLRHSVYAAARTIQVAQTTQADTAVEDDLFFDNDNMGGASAAPPARSAAATQSAFPDGLTQGGPLLLTAASGLGESPLEVCVALIAALGAARPAAAAEALTALLRDQSSEAVPPMAGDAALAALCTLHGAPPAAVAVAADALRVALATARPEAAERATWLLRLLDSVAQLLCEFRGALLEVGEEMQDADAPPSAQRLLLNAFLSLCDAVAQAAPQLRACGLAAGLALADAACTLLSVTPAATPQEVIQLVISLVGDPRYAVRRAMASRFAEMLSNVPEAEHVFVLGDVRPLLAGLRAPADVAPAPTALSAEQALENPRQETTLLLLGEVAAASSPLEAECVFDIIDLAVEHPCHATVALRVLTAAAKRLGYDSRYGLVAQHVAHIAHKWACSGRNIDSMLHVSELLATSEDLKGSELIRTYAPHLLPRLVECNDSVSVGRVAALCGLDHYAVLQAHGARTLAALHSLRANGGDDGLRAFTAVISSPAAVIPLACGGRANVTKLYRTGAVHILRAIVRMVRNTGEAEDTQRWQSIRPVLTVKEAHAAVADLEGVVGQATLWGGDKVARHLLDLHEAFDRAKSPRHRAASLASLSALLQMLEARKLVRAARGSASAMRKLAQMRLAATSRACAPQIAVPSTLRYAVHLLLNLVTTPMLQKHAVELLRRLAEHGLVDGGNGAAAGALGDVLWRWVSRLVACTQAQTPPADGVMQLLHRLVVAAPPWLQPRVAELDPFPEGPAFAQLRATHEALSAGVPLTARLARFCERALGLLPGPRRAAAQALLAALRAPTAAATLRTAAAEAASEVAPTVWQLAQLCEQVDDDMLRELAAVALAVVGPPDPFAVAFHSPGATAGAAALRAPPSGPGSSRRQSGAVSTENEALAGLALRALIGYLVDPDYAIVRAALGATHSLLRTDAGFRALDTLPPLERSYLDVFAGSRADVRADPAQLADADCVPLDDDALWAPPPPGPSFGQAYDAWLRRLSHALACRAQSCTLRVCRQLMGQKADLAALLLPYALEDIAARAGAGASGVALRQLLSARIDAHILRNDAAGARATHALLECLAFLRAARVRAGLDAHRAPSPPDASSPLAWGTVQWLDVDYLCVARAALRCGACFTALQYVEYWCQDAHGALTLGSVDALNDAGALPAHISAALEAHAMCAEPDGIYGMLRAPHVALQLHRSEHEGAWGRSLAAHDAVLRVGGSGAASAAAAAAGVLRALQHLGCPFVLDAAATKLGASGSCAAPLFHEAQMEAAWRAGRWDEAADGALEAGSAATQVTADGFHACLTGALRATHVGETLQCSGLLSRGRASVMRSIALTGAESAASINTAIVRLQLLDEVSDAAEARWGASASAAAGMLHDAAAAQLSRRWTDAHTAHLGERFDLLEPLLAGRAAVMSAVGSATGAAHALAAAAAAARAAGCPGAGLARIHEIKIACTAVVGAGGVAATAAANAVRAPGAVWRDEEAALLWADGQYELALGLARALVTRSPESGLDETMRRASLLSTLGGWLAERHDESASRIRTDNFEQAVTLLTGARNAHQGAAPVLDAALCSAHFQLAKFLDSVQRGLEERMTSPEWKQALQLRASAQAEIALHEQSLRTEKAKSVPRDVKMRENKTAKELTLDRRIRLLQNQVRVEDSARALTQQQHNDALTGCLTAYGECLAAGDSHDTAALFRLVALWYKSAHVPQINTLMGTILAAQRGGGARMLPSAKFLALAWQLVARLEPDDAFTTGFQPVLHALVGRVVRDHPYHSLYQLLALRAADVVGQAQLVNAPKAKVAAAKAVLDSVRASSPRLADIIAQMEVMAGAYTTIALLELTAEQKKASLATLTLPAEVVRMAGLPLVPIATTHLEVDPTCAYARGSFPAFTKFESSASLVGGVNKPRKIRAVGSDGRRYTQLAKGQDDLRQDAVMQQVFGHASALLRGAPGARARSLRMHTYRVVPFNPLAGVVEWAEDTVPLSEWLISGTASAHRRLRPEDMSNSEARDVMDAAHKLGRANLRKPFDDVCDQFHPVLHHFFLESFPTAPLWYERRLAYTRSVAVSSMVGYIIGLGDRHSSNILIGRTSAELVHIDLGVAFDQGKLLNTPETVPFRLTRDIVDGCGAAGVEGVMRRCCEETLTVLRANKESLQTLVEVLIHDPILKWAMTPEQARKRQQEPAEERDVFALEEPGESRMRATATAAADTFAPGAAGVQNADAERALLRVRQKLDGIEEGEPRSVEGQVQQLIQDARDPDKLCRLFPGWAPWV